MLILDCLVYHLNSSATSSLFGNKTNSDWLINITRHGSILLLDEERARKKAVDSRSLHPERIQDTSTQ
jgi:hypothetical protein